PFFFYSSPSFVLSPHPVLVAFQTVFPCDRFTMFGSITIFSVSISVLFTTRLVVAAPSPSHGARSFLLSLREAIPADDISTQCNDTCAPLQNSLTPLDPSDFTDLCTDEIDSEWSACVACEASAEGASETQLQDAFSAFVDACGQQGFALNGSTVPDGPSPGPSPPPGPSPAASSSPASPSPSAPTSAPVASAAPSQVAPGSSNSTASSTTAKPPSTAAASSPSPSPSKKSGAGRVVLSPGAVTLTLLILAAVSVVY
ncbi:hypothetical protein DFH07DRAFT_999008, partial [Mycena maculata]